MLVFRVGVAFDRKHPVTGERVAYAAGALVADPAVVADIRASEHDAHGHMTVLPDDHHAVLPYLPEDHPVRVAHMKMIEDGMDPAQVKENAKVKPRAETSS